MLANMEKGKKLAAQKSGLSLDIGCGAMKQGETWVGIDARALPGVDVVHNVTRFPWPLPDECADRAVSSHLLEHLSPDYGDMRIKPLIELLLAKGLITAEEVADTIGEYGDFPRFLRFMDEVWRVLKPRGQFAIAVPHGHSSGMLQDPSHVNFFNEATWAYFDPFDPAVNGGLWRIYRPMPWKICRLNGSPEANMEVVLEKRPLSDLEEGDKNQRVGVAYE